ncbi:hypothetical protein PVK06_030414 [Gossypium arboreum]|uniref:Uncharacterized protein n=1 Tax=Gossypium arboreum TaxID=29729 RepID=A0ABR0NQR2_GOSAR|nr:hypothetical protein PVK06_030414 [Gossypium arboreum]
MGREGAIDSICDGGNAQTESGDATVRAEATNSATTARHGRATQGTYFGVHVDFDAIVNAEPDADACTFTYAAIDLVIDANFDA